MTDCALLYSLWSKLGRMDDVARLRLEVVVVVVEALCVIIQLHACCWTLLRPLFALKDEAWPWAARCGSVSMSNSNMVELGELVKFQLAVSVKRRGLLALA